MVFNLYIALEIPTTAVELSTRGLDIRCQHTIVLHEWQVHKL